jgi:putative nucleotidyltransferase with HDIG domain
VDNGDYVGFTRALCHRQPSPETRLSSPKTSISARKAPCLGTNGTLDDIPLLGDKSRKPMIYRFFRKKPALPSALHAYAGALALASVSLAAALAAFDRDFGTPWAIAVLALIAIAAERQSVRISPNAEITVSVLPILFATIVYSPLAGMTVAAAGLLGDFGRPFVRWVVWTSLRALAGGLAGLAALLVSRGDQTLPRLILAVAAAAVTEACVDIALGAVVVALRRNGTALDYVRSTRHVLFATVPLYTPVLVLLIHTYSNVSAWTFLLFFGPAFAAHKSYRLYQDQREVAEELARTNTQLERANLSFATALVATLDARDRYTAGHSAAVAVYSRDIAARMGLDDGQQQLVHLCGLVHDIGKVGLPAGLLEKPGPLTLDERRFMEKHAEIGERILSNVEGYSEIARIVRHHHERVDGNGYPDGLNGASVPLLSRIIAVADAYNAMTSDRPYREAMPSRVARLRLAQAVESQFDTSVVAAFEAILAGTDEDYRLAIGVDFALQATSHESLAQEPEIRATAS